MTTTETVSALLAPLLARTVPCPECGNGLYSTPETDSSICGGCSGFGVVPDSRFDALRCHHPDAYVDEGDRLRCEDCHMDDWAWRGPLPMGDRDDLGALVRAAAACGLSLLLVPITRPDSASGSSTGWVALPFASDVALAYEGPVSGKRWGGKTPEEAAALALVTAVEAWDEPGNSP